MYNGHVSGLRDDTDLTPSLCTRPLDGNQMSQRRHIDTFMNAKQAFSERNHISSDTKTLWNTNNQIAESVNIIQLLPYKEPSQLQANPIPQRYFALGIAKRIPNSHTYFRIH